MRRAFALFVLFVFIYSMHAAEKENKSRVYSESFRTLNTHNGFKSPYSVSRFSKVFQDSLKVLPESLLVTSVLFLVNNKFGVDAKQQKRLNEVFKKVYLEISKDKQMANISSALPYCLSSKKPTNGHYFIYLPQKIDKKTKQIIFLHGYGGNFLIYIYVLKNAFRNCIIVVPSWGSSWRYGNYRYIEQVYANVKKRFSIKIKSPILMAISAGGGAAFEFYNDNPYRFESIISLASCPYKNTIAKMKPRLSIVMICGKYDKRFPLQGIKQRIKQLKSKVNDFKLKIITDDHFFFLSSRKKWINFVKESTVLK